MKRGNQKHRKNEDDPFEKFCGNFERRILRGAMLLLTLAAVLKVLANELERPRSDQNVAQVLPATNFIVDLKVKPTVSAQTNLIVVK